MHHRREFLRRTGLKIAALSCASPFPASANPTATAPVTKPQLTRALRRAARFLIERQSDDGSWKSTVYGPFKDGTALTTKQLRVLAALPAELTNKATTAAIQSGMEFVRNCVYYNDGGDLQLTATTYPVYFAADALHLAKLVEPADRQKWQTDWHAKLLELQIGEPLGWSKTDREFGGWSYAKLPPRKPAEGTPQSPLSDPNISATVAALDALRPAKINIDAATQSAAQFLGQLQHTDGGFHFVLDDFVRNKAGGKQVTSNETKLAHTIFYSYGSATCDGLRGLLRCGLPATDARVQRAVKWLKDNFSSEHHPGQYAEDREYSRESVYYYYCASLTRTASEYPQLKLPSDWSRDIATTLLSRQQPDGSWINPAVDVREDDPLVATPLAIEALLSA